MCSNELSKDIRVIQTPVSSRDLELGRRKRAALGCPNRKSRQTTWTSKASTGFLDVESLDTHWFLTLATRARNRASLPESHRTHSAPITLLNDDAAPGPPA
jgi:hypothetical protein